MYNILILFISVIIPMVTICNTSWKSIITLSQYLPFFSDSNCSNLFTWVF